MRHLTSLLLTLTLLACDDGGNSEAPTGDAGTQPTADMATGGAGGEPAADAMPPDAEAPSDADLPDADLPDAAPKVEQPFAETEPVQVSQWLYTSLSGQDPVGNALEQGTFIAPERLGRDDLGVDWAPLFPQDDGALINVDADVGYAVGWVFTAESTSMTLLADRAFTVWFNGRQLPGDVYGSGKLRAALHSNAGDNVLVIQFAGRRGAPRVQLASTTDPVSVNPADLTVPDLPVGEGSTQQLTQYIGLPLLNHGDEALLDVRAQVIEDDRFEGTGTRLPGLAPGAATQLAFELTPKAAFDAAEETVEVSLAITADNLGTIYTTTVSLSTVAADTTHRRSRRSEVDHSVQYYGAVPPVGFDPQVTPESPYGLVLSLHGAGVEGIGQARAYSAKDNAWIIAPTNRRPFGFDWEVWGRLDGLEALDHATATLQTDPARTWLTGHSMGGHGTWHLGVMDTSRFAVIAPSAGWSSFYSYQGLQRPMGVFGRARAPSDTLNYIENLAQRAV
ncbi:MAG: hypothetical protein ACE366_30125 [Bradymonadia bacterium]